jgi:AcrR family transcriptional regulator
MVFRAMQIRKDDIEQQIAKAAKAIFLKKGFAQTSMRDIAKRSGVGLSNIYNYFDSKDDLFRSIVAPVVGEFKRILAVYHDPQQVDITKQWVPEMTEKTAAEYSRIMLKYRDLLTLLLFKSAGSSQARFKDDFTDDAAALMLKYMDAMKRKYPSLKWDFSPFFIHVNAVQLFTLLEEIIMHKISDTEAKRIFMEYTNYHNNGWKELICNNKDDITAI